MPPESIIFPTAPDDPYGGTSLDEPETLDALDEACRIHKPAFVIVDSLTYATRWDIGEQRTIATLKDPLVRLAQTHQVLVMLLLHVSKEGQALGRRIRGITRTLLHLEAPDPTQPDRLRLWVEKSYAGQAARPGSDDRPARQHLRLRPASPAAIPRREEGPPRSSTRPLPSWKAKLAAGDCRASDLIREWTSRGESKGTIFQRQETAWKPMAALWWMHP